MREGWWLMYGVLVDCVIGDDFDGNVPSPAVVYVGALVWCTVQLRLFVRKWLQQEALNISYKLDG